MNNYVRLFVLLTLLGALNVSCQGESQREIVRKTSSLAVWEKIATASVAEEYTHFSNLMVDYANESIEDYEEELNELLYKREVTSHMMFGSSWDQLASTIQLINGGKSNTDNYEKTYANNIKKYVKKVNQVKEGLEDSVVEIVKTSLYDYLNLDGGGEVNDYYDEMEWVRKMAGVPSSVSPRDTTLEKDMAILIIKKACSNVPFPIISDINYKKDIKQWHVSFSNVPQTIDLSFEKSSDGEWKYSYTVNGLEEGE